MTESEGRELAAVPKWGEPLAEWVQARPNTLANFFGVVDADGRTIKGLHIEFEVFVSPRLGLSKFVLSLKRFDLGRIERAYQLHINARPGLRPTDHKYSHEHFGEPRFNADPSWAGASFDDAVQRFCTKATLTLTDQLPPYQAFVLK